MTEPLTTAEVELAVVHYFDPRKNLIIPNISWGFDIHECDLVVLRPSKYMYEVEIAGRSLAISSGTGRFNYGAPHCNC